MVKDDDFKLLRGSDYRKTKRIMDISECRVAFATQSDRYGFHI